MAQRVDLERVAGAENDVVGKIAERVPARAGEMQRPGAGERLDVSQRLREPVGEALRVPGAPECRAVGGSPDLVDRLRVSPWFGGRVGARHARRSI